MSEDTLTIWKENFSFEGRAQGYSVPMDAHPPLGHHYGPAPRELLLVSLAGCSGMDVMGLLKKDNQFVDGLEVETRISGQSSGHPKIFTALQLIFNLEGSIEPASAIKAVELSQTVYCSVSAMLYRTIPITWILFLNGQKIGEGKANFDKFSEIYQSNYEG